jgi:N-acetylglutamate synthase-like GNAT family acetyltransferase
VRELLADAALPEAGMFDRFPAGYVVARRGAEVAGVAGLETYGSAGLLRSVAVAPSLRGRGVGRALVLDRIEAARAAALDAVYLLTTDAAGWFAGIGFAPVARDAAPAGVAASPQMAGACCQAAAFLALRV